MKYFISRELSEKLSVNLAKWKRWSREFLPPDPLGGLQSGYARQYSPAEAFIVFLGGYAVSDLNLSVAETKKMLRDIQVWFEKHGVFQGRNGDMENARMSEHVIVFFRDASRNSFFYHVRHVMSCRTIEKNGIMITEKHYFDEPIQSGSPEVDRQAPVSTRSLHLTQIYKEFEDRLGL